MRRTVSVFAYAVHRFVSVRLPYCLLSVPCGLRLRVLYSTSGCRARTQCSCGSYGGCSVDFSLFVVSFCVSLNFTLSPCEWLALFSPERALSTMPLSPNRRRTPDEDWFLHYPVTMAFSLPPRLRPLFSTNSLRSPHPQTLLIPLHLFFPSMEGTLPHLRPDVILCWSFV